AAEERKALQTELADLEKRFALLQKRGDEIVAAETAFAEKHADWEHNQVLLNTRHGQMQQELHITQAQRQGAETQVAKMTEEMQRSAHGLLDEPEVPAVLNDQAA